MDKKSWIMIVVEWTYVRVAEHTADTEYIALICVCHYSLFLFLNDQKNTMLNAHRAELYFHWIVQLVKGLNTARKLLFHLEILNPLIFIILLINAAAGAVILQTAILIIVLNAEQNYNCQNWNLIVGVELSDLHFNKLINII